jgi:CSLREA domain-containing protein
LALLAVVCLLAFPARATAGQGNSLVVTTTADTVDPSPDCTSGSGSTCSLRDAITMAQGDTGDTINFAPGVAGTIGLASALPAITTTVNISGPGANLLTVFGSNTVTVFSVTGGTTNAPVIISGLTIANGNGVQAGGIANTGTLTLVNCAIASNNGATGGGVFNSGTLTVLGSTIFNNIGASGGGIYSAGTLAVVNSTIAGNSVQGAAPNGYGGGIYSNSGAMTVTNSTINVNYASTGGDGIYILTTPPSTATVTVSNSIVAQNGNGDDCNGCGTQSSYNLIGESTDPELNSLGWNGGPTQTMIPQSESGSAAICGGSSSLAAFGGNPLTTDQRGFGMGASHCSNGGVDLGAVQTNYLLVTTLDDVTDATPDCTTGSGSTCSVRDALTLANSMGSADVSGQGDLFVNWVSDTSQSGTVTLLSPLPQITGNLNVMGPGANMLTIDGGGLGSVLSIASSANVAISGMTFSGGAGSGASGGASGLGGGIFNLGALSLIADAISANTSPSGASGGLYNSGTLFIDGCTINGNTGGGIWNDGSSMMAALLAANSTIAGNTTAGSGGGILNAGSMAALLVTSSTIAGNTAGSTGGSSVGGGIANTGVLGVINSVVAGNTTDGVANSDDCDGCGTQNKHNLIGGTPPTLSVLTYSNSSAALQTMMPLPGSTAINAGKADQLPYWLITDERGFARVNTSAPYSPASPSLDLGAVQTFYSSIDFYNTSLTDTSLNTVITPPPMVEVWETNPGGDSYRVAGIPVTLSFSGGPSEISGQLTETTVTTQFASAASQSAVKTNASPKPNASPGGTYNSIVASFSGLSVNTAGTGYTFTVASPVIGTPPVTNSFDVIDPAQGTYTTSTSLRVVDQAEVNLATTPIYPGDTLYLTATITPTNGTPPGTLYLPSGTVTFYNGATVLGTGTLSPGNSSSTAQYILSTSSLAAGTNLSLTATYTSDGIYQGSSSTPAATVSVQAIPTFVVTTNSDDAGTTPLNCTNQSASGAQPDGACSLRDALLAALHANAGNITFSPTVFATNTTILLTNGPLQIGQQTNVYGLPLGGAASANLVTVDGGSDSPVFQAQFSPYQSSSSLANLNIANGFGNDDADQDSPLLAAGGIVNLGALTVTNCAFTNNNGSDAGAIYNWGGILTVTGSTFTGNHASGYGGTYDRMDWHGDAGAIFNDAWVLYEDEEDLNKLPFTGSTKSFGSLAKTGVKAGASTGASAPQASAGTMNLLSRFSYATLTVTNSTFTNNTGYYGGGIYNPPCATLTVTGSTFTGNQSAGPTADVDLGSAPDAGAIVNLSFGSCGEEEVGVVGVAATSNGAHGASPYAKGSAATGGYKPSATGGGTSSRFSAPARSAGIQGFVSAFAKAASPQVGPPPKGGLSYAAAITVTGSTFTGNSGYYSGGILNTSGMTVTSSPFTNNTAASGSGAIYSRPCGSGCYGEGDVLLVNGSTFTGNNAPAAGGIFNADGELYLSGSTFTGNASSGAGGSVKDTDAPSDGAPGKNPDGGAVANFGGAILAHSTFTGNTSSSGIGAGAISNTEGLLVVRDTITGNTGFSGGVFDPDDEADIANSIVSGDTATNPAPNNPDVNNGNGSDWSDDDFGGNVVDVSAIDVAALGNYGGTTQTMIPLPGSPAICAGSVSDLIDFSGEAQAAGFFLPVTDQRGLPNYNQSYPGFTSKDTPCVDAGSVQTNYALSFTTEPPANVEATANFAAVLTLTESGNLFLPPATIEALGLTQSGTGATLTGGGSASTANGLASYTLSVNLPGTDALMATLLLNPSVPMNSNPAPDSPSVAQPLDAASASSLSLSAASTQFNVTPFITQLAFGAGTPPATLTAGQSAGTVTVLEEGSSGTLSAAGADPITLTITGPGGKVSQTITQTAVGGIATFNPAALQTAGKYTYTAAISGNSSVAPATALETVVPGPAASIALVSGTPQSAVIGAAFANPLLVMVVDQYANPVPGVTVTFTAPTSGASAVLSSGTALTAIDSTGAASASVTATANGTASATAYTVSAGVSGLSTPVIFTLTNTIDSTSLALSLSPASPAYGQPLTITAAINPSKAGGSSPTGTVTFADGSTTLTPASKVTGASASYTVSLPTAGNHTYAAQYNGDTNFSASAQVTKSITVAQATPAVSVTSSSNPVFELTAVTFTASVTSAVGTPTGTVNFLDGTTPLGSGTVAGGVATFSTSTLAIGSHSITAVYSGDTNFVATSSGTLTQAVLDILVSITSGSSPTQTTLPDGMAVFTLTIQPTSGTSFPGPLTLALAGLPSGATVAITPSTWVQASSDSWTLAANTPLTGNTQISIHMPATTALARPAGRLFSRMAPLTLALLLLPFAGRLRRARRRLGRMMSVLVLLGAGMAAMAAMAGLNACSSVNGFYAQTQTTYPLTVTVSSGALSHSTSITLIVQ